jgi:hypothetical protein
MMKRAKMILAAVLALALLSAPLAFGKDANKVDKDVKKKATQTTEIRKQAVPKRPQEQEKKEEAKPKAPVVSPMSVSDRLEKPALEIKPAEPRQMQIEPLSASAVDEKGRQIKWQIVCTGGGCGNDNVRFGFVLQDFHIVCGSVGQTAVGPGSSASFGINSGYWQETIYGFLRGDVNCDGIINLGDVIYLLNYLFKNGPEPRIYAAGDANCDDTIELGDVIYLLNYLFKSGPEPGCEE